jgi:transcriptional regulator of acetoin/glycerol metabolism
MYQKKMMEAQLSESGVRLGDSCSIFPFHGRKKSFTLTRHCIDLISRSYRPRDLSMAFIELPFSGPGHFHYRLELDKGQRFVMKTIEGSAFWLNGLAAREAFVERSDRLYLDDNKVNFDPCGVGELARRSFDHPVLFQENLIRSELNMLVVGETGTGKTDLARKIHEQSKRPGNFVAVNLASFNPQLIESELFGHKKGSFTGAIADREGAFGAADTGTLFLDEIDSLPLELQTKLLSFLDEKKFRPVGSTTQKEIRARLIFASGRKLENLIEQGILRRDFFYRLKSGHTVELNSLRNDLEKIREACRYFGLKHNLSVSEKLIEFYLTLAWPGNLRQLFGHLEKKKVMSRGTKLDFDQVDEELLLQSSDLLSLGDEREILTMEESKMIHFKRAFTLCEGNITITARKLQLSEKTVRTLVSKIS